MRISDWSSDVCSSYLPSARRQTHRRAKPAWQRPRAPARPDPSGDIAPASDFLFFPFQRPLKTPTGLSTHSRTRPAGADGNLSKSLFGDDPPAARGEARPLAPRSEEHTSELQSLMRISYAVFCLKKKKKSHKPATIQTI